MLRRAKLGKGLWLWPVVAILLLLGMVAEQNTRVKPADADPHLLRCKKAIMSIPMTIATASDGTWYGQDVPVPSAATALLRPNIILSRAYTNLGETVSLLIVHCSDARDLQGHYPPRCYPAQGETIINPGMKRTWHLSHMSITGMEYAFGAAAGQIGDQIVYNFFVTPRVPGAVVSHPELDGAICPDIDSVYTSGEDYQRRYFGAAEFQLIFNAEMPQEQRDQAMVELLNPMQNVIRTLMNKDTGGK